jgi:hypothetical protein
MAIAIPTPSPDPQAIAAAKLQAELSGNGVRANVDTGPAPVSPQVDPEASLAAGETIVPASQVNTNNSTTVAPNKANPVAYDDEGNLLPGYTLTENNDPVYVGSGFVEPATLKSAAASRIQGATYLARQAQAISSQRGQQQAADWRVRLQLAQSADYLYKAIEPGILQPLAATDGIIFPYTPKIDLSYKANYSPYDITHSNFRGYFYQNSSVGDINITGHFTAQDTNQANYLLAVIHFFRSATKMFYGQDAQRGTPPPLVFLSGLGQYQFNNHPCLITNFSYSLPEDVDYIRAQVVNQANLNLTSVNSVKTAVPTNTIVASISRLAAAFTTKGALPKKPFGSSNAPNLALGSPTYVPTKMDITISLLPVNSRQQVSQQFSLKNFANGNQLKGGFW